MAIFRRPSGEEVSLSVDRKEKLTVAQHIARRNEQWLVAVTDGVIDARTGKTKVSTTQELAGLWRVSERTVRRGIKSACAARNAIRAARQRSTDRAVMAY